MRFRLFGLDDCEKCNAMRQEFSESGIVYFYVDALKPETQELCDKYNIDETPRIQLINNDGKVLYEKIGYIEVIELVKIAKKIEERFQKIQTE